MAFGAEARWIVGLVPLPFVWIGLEALRAHDPRIALLTGALALALAAGLLLRPLRE